MPYRFTISPGPRAADGPVLSPRDAAATLRREHGTASITAIPAPYRSPDWTTGATLRAAIADYPHAIRAGAGPCYVRAVWVD